MKIQGRHHLVAWSCLFLVGLLAAVESHGEEVAVIKTSQGEIAWRFFTSTAPGHARYVKELIRRGFYDGTTFHRVIPHFVIQGGDPNSKNVDRSDDGEGQAEKTLKAEFSQELHYRPGTVGMARDQSPDSGSCQFFIALENLPRLDAKYTIFGEVISGLEVARKIADLPRDLNDNPLERVVVTVRLEERAVPARILSRESADASGETLTGPARRPRPLDPGDVLWRAPILKSKATVETGFSPQPLDVCIDEEGKVIDVRFPQIDTPQASKIKNQVRQWTFEPATYEGKPQRVRCRIDSYGQQVGAPEGSGAPVEVSNRITPPVPMVRVEIPAHVTAPSQTALLRLLIGANGAVLEVALQKSCGDPTWDAKAVDTARTMHFQPARQATSSGSKEPAPIAVYLNVETVFMETSKP
jgi:peptidyl-prolyl cis-trans isomerase B (cyclophilin B)